MEIISIGHSNYLPVSIILGIYTVESRPMRSLISKAKTDKKLIRATRNKKTKSAIILKDGYIVLSSISPATLANRFAGKVNTSSFAESPEDQIQEDISTDEN